MYYYRVKNSKRNEQILKEINEALAFCEAFMDRLTRMKKVVSQKVEPGNANLR
jgi:hypothetical protein